MPVPWEGVAGGILWLLRNESGGRTGPARGGHKQGWSPGSGGHTSGFLELCFLIIQQESEVRSFQVFLAQNLSSAILF